MQYKTYYGKMDPRPEEGDRQWLEVGGRRPGEPACSGKYLCLTSMRKIL